MKISFIGLGTMGGGMAMNLATKGNFEFLAINRSEKGLKPFIENNIPVSQNLKDAADGDCTFLCLPDGTIVREVLLGINGIAHKMKPGHIIVDCSTISYLEAKEIASELSLLGIEYMDAPVSGHHAKAMDGTLTIMCGGKKEIFDQIKPYFDLMGTTVLYMGETGAGQLTKMINNCALNICTASFCELMPVGVKLGLDPEAIGKVLMTASGSSYASKTLIPEILENNFAHGFTMGLAYKDMLSMSEVCNKFAIPLPTLLGTMQTYQLAIQCGYANEYKGAMIKFFEKLLGVECRKSQ